MDLHGSYAELAFQVFSHEFDAILVYKAAVLCFLAFPSLPNRAAKTSCRSLPV